ncbi:MAG: PH domain-containing protein [Candidatus Poribacteria bacterium]
MSGGAYIGKGVDQRALDEAKQRCFASDENLFCVIKGVAYKDERKGRREYSVRRSGLLLITSKRAMFYCSMMFGRYDQIIFPYDQISSVTSYKGMFGDELHLMVGANEMVIHNIPKGDGDIAAKNIRDLIATMKAQPIVAVAAQAPQTDIVDQIEKLAKLKEKGLITEEEFERKKNELLKRL